jgi:hypothetical protein
VLLVVEVLIGILNGKVDIGVLELKILEERLGRLSGNEVVIKLPLDIFLLLRHIEGLVRECKSGFDNLLFGLGRHASGSLVNGSYLCLCGPEEISEFLDFLITTVNQ